MRSGVGVHALALDADVPGVDRDRHGERRVEPLPAPRLGQLAVWNIKKEIITIIMEAFFGRK